MKKLTLFTLGILFLSIHARIVLASEVYYLTLRSGEIALSKTLYDDPDLGEQAVKYEDGTLSSAAFGWSFMDGRIEIEATKRENNVESLGGSAVTDIRFTVQSLMLNGFYDIEMWSSWNPYVGFGFGGAMVTVEEAGVEDDDFVLAYQAGGGVTRRFAKNLGIDLQYWFTVTSEYEVLVRANEYSDLLMGHNVSLGLRYYFE